MRRRNVVETQNPGRLAVSRAHAFEQAVHRAFERRLRGARQTVDHARARTPAPLDQSVRRELVERLLRRYARDPILPGKLLLAGQETSERMGSVDDLLTQHEEELVKQRRR